jgi:DNA replication protein DnaC
MDTPKVCPVCDDTGWKTIGHGSDRRVTRCDCRRQERNQKLLQQARIPRRYEHCELSNFDVRNSSLSLARIAAQQLAAAYPAEKTGLMLIGPAGVGKTHLAVAIIRELLAKGVPCLFCEYGDLLQAIRNSYNPAVETTEMELLRPVLTTEVLVLDELGSQRVSDWVWDTVGQIINRRYNDNLTTIVTTNFDAESPAPSDEPIDLSGTDKPKGKKKKTLGDQITQRLLSRLHEMCKVVKMEGEDFRTHVRAASISVISKHTPGFRLRISRSPKPPQNDSQD